MVLYLIGLGLGDAKDITLKGIDRVKKSDYVYLESYTSKLACPISELEQLYGKKIILADRAFVEDGWEILKHSKKQNVALLIIGDVFGATTHISLWKQAVEEGITVEIIHNASILTAVGETGLELYKFGKVTSIPFAHKDVVTPVTVFKENQSLGLHTLFLLDLDPLHVKYMSVSEATQYLVNKGVDKKLTAVACCALGTKHAKIVVRSLNDFKDFKYPHYPQCLIIPGKLHFVEEECLELFKD